MAKLLVLTSRVCYPPREGHQLRTWHLLRELAREHEITLLSFARVDDDLAACAPLRDLCARFETFAIPAEHSRWVLAGCLLRGLLGKRPFVVEKYTSEDFSARVAELLAEADLVHVDMLPLMSAIDTAATSSPIILNAHNVEYQLLAQRAAIETRLLRRLYLRHQVAKLERFEALACRRADQVLACSAVDAEQLSKLAPLTSLSVVPNGVDTRLNQPDAQREPVPTEMVFVGQMGWFPNMDAMRWFLTEILPKVIAVRSDTILVLVGKAAELIIPAALAGNVRRAGFVDDVRATIQRAAIYIVPLRAGSGTRLKVLEAMALGMPIVTTKIGAEGIALQHDKSALFADTSDAFAAAILHLLANPKDAAGLGAAARELAVNTYDWLPIGTELRAIYQRLMQDHDDTLRARQR